MKRVFVIVGILLFSGCADPTEDGTPPESSLGTSTARPAGPTAEAKPEPSDHEVLHTGWVLSSPRPWTAEFPFPVNSTQGNLSLRVEVAGEYPGLGSLPRETSNFTVVVVDATGTGSVVGGRESGMPNSPVTFDVDAPLVRGPWAVHLSVYGGSDGQSAGDRYRVFVFVNNE